MRRFHALLIAAGLAAMPASAAAGPSHDSWSTPQVFEKYELSTSRGRLGVMVMSLTAERPHAANLPFCNACLNWARQSNLAEWDELGAGD